MMDEKSLVNQLYEDFSHVLKEAQSMGCNEILALRNIPLENMEEIVNALKIASDLKERNMDLETLENYMQFEDECVKNNFTFLSILNAREKQIEKEPCKLLDKPGYYVCPTCGSHDGICNVTKYCSDCGQKINWDSI